MHPPTLLQTNNGYTFPVTTCIFQCSNLCSNTTNHYCMEDDPSGLFFYDGRRICGKAFCNICAVNSGYESTQFCPHCHADSSLKLRRSPRKTSINLPTRILHTPSISQGTAKSNGSGDTQGNHVERNLQLMDDFSTPNSQLRECLSPSSEQPVTLDQLVDVVLKCPSVFEDDHKFFIMMQDEGEPLSVSKRCKNGYWKCKQDDKQYKELKIAGEDLIRRLRSMPQYFAKIPNTQSTYGLLNTVCNWFVRLRKLNAVKRGEMSERSHSSHFQYVRDDQDMNKVYYLVDQRDILRKAVSLWGTTLEKEMKTFTNDDYARLIGIMLQESFRDKLDVLNDRRKSRMVLDDKANMSKKACFNAAAEDFRDSSITILHPVRWEKVIEMHGDPCIEPNNVARICLPWTGENMMSMYDSVMIKYKATMKNWTKGTGGGSGAPENYSTWQIRDEAEYFEGYAKVYGGSHELTWIYMQDKARGFPLWSTFQGLPTSACLDDGNVPDEDTSPTVRDLPKKLAAEVRAMNTMESNLISNLNDIKSFIIRDASNDDEAAGSKKQGRKRELVDILNDINVFEGRIKEKMKKMKALDKKMEKLSQDDKEARENLLAAVTSLEDEIGAYMDSKDQLLNEMKEATRHRNSQPQATSRRSRTTYYFSSSDSDSD